MKFLNARLILRRETSRCTKMSTSPNCPAAEAIKKLFERIPDNIGFDDPLPEGVGEALLGHVGGIRRGFERKRLDNVEARFAKSRTPD